VSLTGTVAGHLAHLQFGVCDQQVAQWMRITGYTPCPGNFTWFTCTHGPYAFGGAHMNGLHPTVRNVVGMTATKAMRTLRRAGLQTSFNAPLATHEPNLVTAESPAARASANVYQVIKLALNTGCGFC
jgi:hypothetical protein